MLKVGDKVRLTTNDLTGTVTAIYEFSSWNMTDDEYGIELDYGGGLVNIAARLLIKITPDHRCECGLNFARSGGRHNTWCSLYKGDEE